MCVGWARAPDNIVIKDIKQSKIVPSSDLITLSQHLIMILCFLMVQILPAFAYLDNPSTSFAAKFVHTSLNKNRCSINCVAVSWRVLLGLLSFRLCFSCVYVWFCVYTQLSYCVQKQTCIFVHVICGTFSFSWRPNVVDTIPFLYISHNCQVFKFVNIRSLNFEVNTSLSN